MQLLGPDYSERLSDRSPWIVEPAGSTSALVSHEQPDAWYSQPFVPFQSTAVDPPPPPILVSARRQLAPLLYQPGVLAAHGYPDIKDSW